MPGIGVYELVPGTRVTLPGVPGRWWRRTVVGSVLVGEFRFKSEPGFSGSQLTLHTPEGLVEITGTLLSIQCDDSGTCVCVLEGHVRVGVDRDDLELIEPGSRKVMLRNGEVKIVPVKPMHRDGVLEFADRIGAVTEEE
jgi:ferric-dicitrate binding protein FerR (iron transport regulator)